MPALRALGWALVVAGLVIGSSIVYAGVVSARAPTSADTSPGPTYNVTFSESGLPAGTNWSVAVAPSPGSGGGGHWVHRGGFGTSNTSTIVLALPNGSYRYFVRPVAGFSLADNGSRGTFNVSGAAAGPIAVTFSRIVTYTVTFTESGLPSGTEWFVRMRGDWGDGGSGWGLGFGPRDRDSAGASSNTTTITFSLPNGSYTYRVHAAGYVDSNGPRGTFNVSGGAVAISVPFVSVSAPRPTYNVTFEESGLAAGTNWTVRVVGGFGGFFGGDHRRGGETSNTTLTLALPNGSYRYVIGNVPGYSIADNGSTGTFNVSGAAPATIHVAFVRLVPYTVTFSETGLPSGANWTVLVVGAEPFGGSGPIVSSSNGSTITLSLTNGSYGFHVPPTDGYAAGNSSFGTFNVSGGSPPTIDITFTLHSGGGFAPATPLAARA